MNHGPGSPDQFLTYFSLPVSLFVSQSRRAHNIELNGAVVIFDEAHNVVSFCGWHHLLISLSLYFKIDINDYLYIWLTD